MIQDFADTLITLLNDNGFPIVPIQSQFFGVYGSTNNSHEVFCHGYSLAFKACLKNFRNMVSVFEPLASCLSSPLLANTSKKS